ncbi:hypothetical protein ACWIUD_07115 [Helicobacter sp. 23-1044]
MQTLQISVANFRGNPKKTTPSLRDLTKSNRGNPFLNFTILVSFAESTPFFRHCEEVRSTDEAIQKNCHTERSEVSLLHFRFCDSAILR